MNTRLPVLAPRFSGVDRYRSPAHAPYQLLPLRFTELDADRFVVSNLVGEFVVLPKPVVRDFVSHKLRPHSDAYNELKSRHFLMDGESSVCLDLLATKYRTKQALLSRFTSLFLFVTTLRCDHSCPYCQVSRQSQDRHAFDMSHETARLAVDFVFKSPSQNIKIEFQGGETLLNFELVRHVVALVEERNRSEGRDISFVIATNLSPLTDEHLAFCVDHGISISTSLDGPEALHNRNRPNPTRDSHARTLSGITRARSALGHDAVSALMTTTEASLSQPREIVDEYIRLGFHSIFLRSISPYGFATRTGWAHKYDADRWMTFYRAAVDHIIGINLAGTLFREQYASLILTKMLTPWSTGYVDLQSPAGLGIAAIVFNYDGDIYASDESRMLAEMNDKTFCLGKLSRDHFEDVMRSPVLADALRSTMTEGVPMCSDCAFQPYCGADPVFHHATQGDMVGFKPTSEFCCKHMGLFRHLIGILEQQGEPARVLRSWI